MVVHNLAPRKKLAVQDYTISERRNKKNLIARTLKLRLFVNFINFINFREGFVAYIPAILCAFSGYLREFFQLIVRIPKFEAGRLM